jgi:hypothetical protein
VKLVFSKQELMTALAFNSERALDTALPRLVRLGFPTRVPGLGARWSVAAVEAWINSHHATLQPVQALPCDAPAHATDAGTPPLPASVFQIQQHLEQRIAERRKV